MELKQIVLAMTIAAVTLMPGCKSSSGPRLGWWKPTSMWGKSSDAEPTALANSAPALPSSKFEPMEPSATSVASNTAPATSGTSRDLLAAAPSSKSPAASSAEYLSPNATSADVPPAAMTSLPPTSTAATTPGTTPASTLAPQASPYSNQGYAASATPAVDVAAPSSQGGDRYAPVDRYASVPSASTPPLSSSPTDPIAVTPPTSPSVEPVAEPMNSPGAVTSTPMASITPTAPPSSRYDRYERYSDPVPPAEESPSVASNTLPPLATTPSGVTSPPATESSASVAQVQLPSSPQGYRPGGTSTYTPSSAANIATRPATPESGSGYQVPRYQEQPTQPASPGSYGAPSYR